VTISDGGYFITVIFDASIRRCSEKNLERGPQNHWKFLVFFPLKNTNIVLLLFLRLTLFENLIKITM
jgi:hypothetical protein